MSELYKLVIDWAALIGLIGFTIFAVGGVIWSNAGSGSIRRHGSANQSLYANYYDALVRAYGYHLLLPWFLEQLRLDGLSRRQDSLVAVGLLAVQYMIWLGGVMALNLIIIHDNYGILTGRELLHPTTPDTNGVTYTIAFLLIGPLAMNVLWFILSLQSIFNFLTKPLYTTNWLSSTSAPPTYSVSVTVTFALMFILWIMVAFNVPSHNLLAGELRIFATLAAVPYGLILGFWFYFHLRLRRCYEGLVEGLPQHPPMLDPAYLKPFAYSIFGMILSLWSFGLIFSIT